MNNISEQGYKFYFLKNNGNIILTIGECKGWIIPSTQDEDFENYSELHKYNRDQVGVIELQYGELDKLLAENKANTYKVDVTGEPKLVFSYIDYNTGEPTTPPLTIEEIVEKKINEVKADVMVDVVKLIITKDKKMEAKDVPPLTSVSDIGTINNVDIPNISELSGLDIPKLDPSMIPPPPKFE